MANAGADIKGDKALRKMLQQLPAKSQRKIIRQSVNKAATPILKDARRRVPVDESQLKETLAKKTRSYKQSFTILALIGPRAKEAPHAHLVEYGTGPRYQKRSGRYTGIMPAHPFLRPAMDNNQGAVLSDFRKKWRQAIPREAERLAKKGR